MLKKDIPLWMIVLQCACFSLLYAIWALPETILMRHIFLILGTLIGLYEIFHYRKLFFQKNSIPSWLLGALFLWATLHLIFFSQNFFSQRVEFEGTWKRTALAAIFALGFGVALVNRKLDFKIAKLLWVIFYLGLLAPSIIYLVKFLLTDLAASDGWLIPAYWRVDPKEGPFYLHKASYVCFCLPVLAVSLGQIYRNSRLDRLVNWENIIYLLTIPLVLFVFYSENIKNGMAYGLVLILFFSSLIFIKGVKKNVIVKLTIVALIVLLSGIFFNLHFRENSSWKIFAADFKVAIQTDKYPEWRYGGGHGFPNNEFGEKVSVTNYERIAWGKVGLGLILKNPLGYGLIEASFGNLAVATWNDSINLKQTHSGWIDLGLGLGLPGLLIIISSLILVIYQLIKLNSGDINNSYIFNLAVCCILLAMLLLWCTTEASQKILFDTLIFWITFGSGLSMIDDKLITKGRD